MQWYKGHDQLRIRREKRLQVAVYKNRYKWPTSIQLRNKDSWTKAIPWLVCRYTKMQNKISWLYNLRFSSSKTVFAQNLPVPEHYYVINRTS